MCMCVQDRVHVCKRKKGHKNLNKRIKEMKNKSLKQKHNQKLDIHNYRECVDHTVTCECFILWLRTDSICPHTLLKPP